MRCSAITSGGTRCKGEATTGSSYCWSHDPATVEARRQRGRKGGKARGAAGELVAVKREVKTVIKDVLSGDVERGAGAVALQGYNALLKALEAERRVREQEELTERLEAVEERLKRAKTDGHGGGSWYG